MQCTIMSRSVPLCAGQSGDERRNGCQTKFKRIFWLPSRGCIARPYGSSDWDGYMEFSSSAFATGQEQSGQM
jgi:hypothetical protein